MNAEISAAGSRVQELLEKIVAGCGIDASVHVEEDSEEVRADLRGR